MTDRSHSEEIDLNTYFNVPVVARFILKSRSAIDGGTVENVNSDQSLVHRLVAILWGLRLC